MGEGGREDGRVGYLKYVCTPFFLQIAIEVRLELLLTAFVL
jgi:hypothetical protein